MGQGLGRGRLGPQGAALGGTGAEASCYKKRLGQGVRPTAQTLLQPAAGSLALA